MSSHSVVLLPGLGFKSSIWDFITPSLKDYQVTLIDLPEIDNLDIKKIIDIIASKISDNSIIIGWSLGGLIATYLYHLLPHKCSKLALIASTPKFMEDKNWPGITLSQIESNMKNFSGIVQYPNKSTQVRRYLAEHQTAVPANHLKLIKSLDAREIYNNLKIPVLNILGEKDAIIPLRQTEYFPRFHQIIIIPKAGHVPFLTHTEIIKDELIRFIDLC
ncbi:alpha/beta fold hydrolase [Rickettsiales endosymbiont of Stachyamoeba lipophora]|uniref:alpha/beta fold hydrolase n=1 Tax=Rickettsiales endosymbiont of Stachyamoeba lipophora TaxID=2486578 RepID=UPI000F64957D|nr:alpha/beta fold hydrolase [Rickettsiales endosymbiont of Stachyamoeba lipophora]AZL16077.1 alpha/beta fold hydrolase [Rickettsiales endosymbiont of Stachyamoeba lipophora]